MGKEEKSQFQLDIEAQRKLCTDNVASWEYKLKEATTQLEYWKMQKEAILAVSTRLMLDGWAANATREKEKSEVIK